MKYLTHSLLIVAMLLSLSACHHKGGDNPFADTTNINLEGVMRQPCAGFEFIAIQDHEQQMSADLFRGTDDQLLATLLPAGEAEASINVFLLASEQQNILFDAGLGADNGGLLLQKLSALNLNPEDIDAIFLTHLHPDHIGGLLYNDGPAFPKAQLFLSTAEFEAWTNGPLAKQNDLVTQVLACYADRVNLFNDGDTLDEAHHFPVKSFLDVYSGTSHSVVAHVAPGHTPGHALYTIENILIAGDLLHAQALQFDHPEFCAKFDYDRAMAVSARRQWLDRAKQEHLLFAGMHLPAPYSVEMGQE